MLPHLTPMIAALSLALIADSVPGWSKLQSAFQHRCTETHKHAVEGRAQPVRKVVVKRHQLHEMQVLSFGP